MLTEEELIKIERRRLAHPRLYSCVAREYRWKVSGWVALALGILHLLDYYIAKNSEALLPALIFLLGGVGILAWYKYVAPVNFPLDY